MYGSHKSDVVELNESGIEIRAKNRQKKFIELQVRTVTYYIYMFISQ